MRASSVNRQAARHRLAAATRLAPLGSLILVALAGCSSSDTTATGDDLAVAGEVDLSVVADLAPASDLTQDPPDLTGYSGADAGLTLSRPYHFYVPPGYDKNTPAPLVVMLHGYTASGDAQELYWQLKPVADAHTFLYAYPDGTVDAFGNRFWNATDGCCDIGKTGVDDVAYVNAVIDDVENKYNVDPKRIFITGHSNGGFMSHRLACDAPRVAAIVSLAGAVWKDPSKCNPAGKIAVLEIHGDADAVIPYNGGAYSGLAAFPSAPDTVATWAAKNGCSGALAPSGQTLDLDSSLLGAETVVSRYSGCPAHGEVELWTILGGGHVPILQPTWGETIYGFMASHPKP
jgi:polyhydroxybutyrate depolymerase